MHKKTVIMALVAMMAMAAGWRGPGWAAPPRPRPALGQDAKTIPSNVDKAMGAHNLKSLQYSGTAKEFAFGQAVNASSPWPGFAEKAYTRTINYETPAWRVDRVLAPIPPDRRGGGLPPGPTQTVVIGANTAWGQQVDLWLTPYGFLREAANNSVTATSKSMGGKKYTVLTFTAPNKAKFSGYIDEENMLPRV